MQSEVEMSTVRPASKEPFPGRKCALFIAHPGHELAVHHFLETYRPLVAILTDGSGATGRSRLSSTDACLEPSGAEASSFYGRFTDQRCYTALLSGEVNFFIGIAEELATVLSEKDIETVVGDAMEGWNSIHDIWRSVVNLSVGLASAQGQRDIENFEFPLFRPHAAGLQPSQRRGFVVTLDELSYKRKVTAALGYPELQREVSAALQGTAPRSVPPGALSGPDEERLLALNAVSYRHESFRRVNIKRQGVSVDASVPVYEQYGDMAVAMGRYRETIRFQRHLLPITTALDAYAQRKRS